MNFFVSFGLIVLCLLLNGCASSSSGFVDWFSKPDSVEKMPVPEVVDDKPDNGIRYRADSRQLMAETTAQDSQQAVAIYRTPNSVYQPSFSHKSLSGYAEQLTMQLVTNGRQLNTQSKVGVASFVNFDQTLKQTSVLGNQLAEMLISEVQSFGVQVVDFKTTNSIVVGASGDMVFSREARQLSQQLDLDYILSGTLIHNAHGVRVNARIVSMGTKVVVSSASLLIPNFVVESLQPQYVVLGE